MFKKIDKIWVEYVRDNDIDIDYMFSREDDREYYKKAMKMGNIIFIGIIAFAKIATSYYDIMHWTINEIHSNGKWGLEYHVFEKEYIRKKQEKNFRIIEKLQIEDLKRTLIVLGFDIKDMPTEYEVIGKF